MSNIAEDIVKTYAYKLGMVDQLYLRKAIDAALDAALDDEQDDVKEWRCTSRESIDLKNFDAIKNAIKLRKLLEKQLRKDT